ncbi:MAG: DNA/RNA non-specific endonuclease [Nitrospira sp.]
MRPGSLSLAIFLILILPPSPTLAHRGGLDSFGCHSNRTSGIYECHKGQFSGRSFASKTEMQQVSDSPTPILPQGLFGCAEHLKFGVPSNEPVLLCRTGYALSHDSKLKVADWVIYHLTRRKVAGRHPRIDRFRSDPDLGKENRATLNDYRKSGYDRGHMAPAGSMKWDARAMSESFLLSNIVPQVGAGFNRGIWRVLEERVRKWTTERGELYIITGPIFEGPPKTIGKNNVAVPSHFFKIIFDPIQIEVIAFVMPNRRLETKDLPKQITSVDAIEGRTGLDFLSRLEDGIEERIEGMTQNQLW